MDRSEFIGMVSASLGRTAAPETVNFDSRYGELANAVESADTVRSEARENSTELAHTAAVALADSGWQVHRATTVEDVGDVLSAVCADSEIRNVVRTDHAILDSANVDAVLSRAGVECDVTRLQATTSDEAERRDQIESAKQRMFEVDAGITGGDYLIAETGTLVIHPGSGVARLASLAPPIHIAVVHTNQVLPSLDELFLLEHVDIATGNRASGMNLISGPSRTGDIEAQIVYGIHGPIETHIILVG